MSAVHLGFFNTSSTRTHVRFQFSTHAAAGGNVAPNSAFEAADLRIYKAADAAAFSATQRSSANGITMTSPFDSLTGVHDVVIDLTDNSDASFYAAGSFYSVVLAPDETVDGQTITGIVLAYFEIGVAKADVTQFGGTAGTFASGIPEVKVASLANNAITAASINADAITAAKIADGAIDAATFAANAITAAKLDPDVTTELQNGLATASALATVDTVVDAIKAVTDLLPDAGALSSLATQASVNTIDDFLDTEIAAILAAVDTEVASILSAVDTEVAAIKAKTDSLTFTVANVLDANIQRINDVTVNGDGAGTPWGP